MTECRLDDDGYPSGDFIVIEEIPEGPQRVTPQALWVGVRPVFHGSEPGEIMIQVCYQKAHMASSLAGPVWITPEVWRQLNRAVRWRLRHRKWLDTKKKGEQWKSWLLTGMQASTRRTHGSCGRR